MNKAPSVVFLQVQRDGHDDHITTLQNMPCDDDIAYQDIEDEHEDDEEEWP